MVKFGRKFFFDTKHSKRRKLITYIIAGVGIILFIIILALIIRGIKKRKPKTTPAPKAEIVLREELTAELYSPLPDKTAYFEKLENFNVDDITITYPSYLPLEPSYENCNEEQLKVLEEIKNGKDESEFENPNACVTDVPTGVGKYDVKVSYNGEEYTVVLSIEDNQAPTLVVKNLEIVEGTTYSPSDFVESCVDNSKKECTYDYYYKEYNSDVDYGKYVEPGTYSISIVAIDGSGNSTVPEDVTLIITEKPIQIFTVSFNPENGSTINSQYVNEGERASSPSNPTKSGYTFAGWYNGNDKFDFNTAITSDITLTAKWNKNASTSTPKPKASTCSNGDLKYDASKYPTVALFVSDGNCAISKNNLTQLTKGSKLNIMMSTEVEKLRNWQKQTGVEYCIRVVNDKPQGVLNTSGKGYVGYTIEFSVAKAEIINGQCTAPATEVARYFLNDKGNRVFSLNIINMPES